MTTSYSIFNARRVYTYLCIKLIIFYCTILVTIKEDKRFRLSRSLYLFSKYRNNFSMWISPYGMYYHKYREILSAATAASRALRWTKFFESWFFVRNKLFSRVARGKQRTSLPKFFRLTSIYVRYIAESWMKSQIFQDNSITRRKMRILDHEGMISKFQASFGEIAEGLVLSKPRIRIWKKRKRNESKFGK